MTLCVADNVFGAEATTAEVFTTTAKSIVQSVCRGYNGTIFAYGQTASGKTHTMQGVLSQWRTVRVQVAVAFTALLVVGAITLLYQRVQAPARIPASSPWP